MSGEHTLKAVRGSFIDVTRTVDNPGRNCLCAAVY